MNMFLGLTFYALNLPLFMYSVKDSVIVNGIESQQAATGDYTQLFLAK